MPATLTSRFSSKKGLGIKKGIHPWRTNQTPHPTLVQPERSLMSGVLSSHSNPPSLSMGDFPLQGHGHNHLILGCMWSEKSTSLLRQAKRARLLNHASLLVIKPVIDTRDGDKIKTHSNMELPADAFVRNGQEAIAAIEFHAMPDKPLIILIVDEAQFLSGVADLALFVLHHPTLPNHSIVAHYGALDGTAERKMFQPIVELLPLATTTVKLLAICMCCQNAEAPYTRRDHSPVTGDGVIAPGGSEMYSAVCGPCYHHKQCRPRLQAS